ncbi:hypothetical protein E1J22_02030 [Xanthomonas citri]|nr:hypothetical protein [Xanthomonas citri]
MRLLAKMQRLFLLARRGPHPKTLFDDSTASPVRSHVWRHRRTAMGRATHPPQTRLQTASHRAIVQSPAARRLPGSGRILIGEAGFFHLTHE